MSLHDDLVAAKALIDTPNKLEALKRDAYDAAVKAVIDATASIDEAWAVTCALRHELPDYPTRPSLASFYRANGHPDIMALFDRAIAAASVSP